MTSKLKIIPLGGLGEIGKNMTVIEFGNDLILIDRVLKHGRIYICPPQIYACHVLKAEAASAGFASARR